MADPVTSALHLGIARLTRRGLRGIWIRGTIPRAPFVWAANHHSWWDPFVAAAVLRERGDAAAVVMDETNLRRYRIAGRLGAIGTSEARRGLELLDSGRVLVIYPEGELRPPGPPGPLAPGAGWYARKAGVPLCAAAVRVAMRGHQVPEAYVSASVVESPALLADRLAAGLCRIDGLLAATAPRSPLPGFGQVLRGWRSWDERL